MGSMTEAGREIEVRLRMGSIIQDKTYWDRVSGKSFDPVALKEVYIESTMSRTPMANMVENMILGAFREIAESEVGENETQSEGTKRGNHKLT